jgi:hypothetical protein
MRSVARFYSEDVLWSDRARQVFVMPRGDASHA